MSVRTLLVATLVGSYLPWLVAPAARAEEPACDVSAVPGSERLADAETDDNPVFDRMHVRDAHRLSRGRGTKVAVIDSGVVAVPGLAVTRLAPAAGVVPEVRSGHGTLAASLIAGPHGVAPEARVFDIKVFDQEGADPTQGQVPVTSAGIAAGVRAAIAAHGREGFDVVNISLSVDVDDPELRRAVADLVALDVVVVASSGNRTTTPGAAEAPAPTGDDADVYPADYPDVLAVSALAPEGSAPGDFVLPNRDTDVAAPTVGAVSANATGQVCVIGEVATSWAAAEVSGVVALLRERFPRDNAAQTVARLVATTEGGALGDDGVRSPWVGAGVVQAHDALARELTISRDGSLRGSLARPRLDAQAPPPPVQFDPFGTSRALLLWFGLGAGSLLALAFMLRPLLRRLAIRHADPHP